MFSHSSLMMIMVIAALNCVARYRDYMLFRELEISHICHTLICDVLLFDFKDKIGSVCHPISDDEVFLYIRPHSSGGKGEACRYQPWILNWIFN